MRTPAVTARSVLHARLSAPAQVSTLEPTLEALPPYLESFLAHLRLMVGVPFEYLVPDGRLLPPESIRFFYLDRSWTDRLVDGAAAVGQIGSREGAHYHAHAPNVGATLDQSERMVRSMQRGTSFDDAKAGLPQSTPADLVTGFVLRSSAVAHWPHMDVRAYRRIIEEPYDTVDHVEEQLRLLRLERIAPSVMIALFQGEPEMVILEEPHHGVQFGVRHAANGLSVPTRGADGNQVLDAAHRSIEMTVPMRAGHNDVVRIAALRHRLLDQQSHGELTQDGSAAFAVAVLDPPWRQHFQGTEDGAGVGEPFDRRFLEVSAIQRPAILMTALTTLIEGH